MNSSMDVLLISHFSYNSGSVLSSLAYFVSFTSFLSFFVFSLILLSLFFFLPFLFFISPPSLPLLPLSSLFPPPLHRFLSMSLIVCQSMFSQKAFQFSCPWVSDLEQGILCAGEGSGQRRGWRGPETTMKKARAEDDDVEGTGWEPR